MATIVFGGLLVWLFMHREKPVRFRPRSVLTGSELDFFFRLRAALPTCIVCPQVASSALLEPAGMGAARQQAMARIEGGRVGYAVFDQEMRLMAIVELNHRSRVRRRDIARDRYFSSAGIRTVRFHTKHLPSPKQIETSIFAQTPVRQRQRTHIRSENFRRRHVESPWRNTTKIRL